MARYEALTKFIDELEACGTWGTWMPDNTSKDTSFQSSSQLQSKSALSMPYVDYEEVVDRLITEFYMGGFVITDYQDYIRLMERKTEGNLEALDFGSMEEQDVLAFLTFVVRTDRFCEGTLLAHLQNGSFMACLKRLRDIDNDSCFVAL